MYVIKRNYSLVSCSLRNCYCSSRNGNPQHEIFTQNTDETTEAAVHSCYLQNSSCKTFHKIQRKATVLDSYINKIYRKQ